MARPRVARHRHRAHQQHHPGRAHVTALVPHGLPLVLRSHHLRPAGVRRHVSRRQQGPGGRRWGGARDEADHHRRREQRRGVLGRGAADVGDIDVARLPVRPGDSRVHPAGVEATAG